MDQQQKDSVIKALENPKFKWRTLSGVAKETNLDQQTVAAILNLIHDNLVESANVLKSEELLLTTRKHFLEKATAFEKIQGAFKNRLR